MTTIVETPDARAEQRAGFLAASDWRDAAVRPLAGDASNRRYFRLRRASGASAMLMDASPAVGEDVRPFAAITGLLRGWGFAAPEILEADLDGGFLILEDLGDGLYARVVEAREGRADEETLYEAAVDLLADLARRPAPPLAAGYGAVTPIRPYDGHILTREAELTPDWYAVGALGAAPADARAAFDAALADALAPVSAARAVLVLRDYHAENLMWQPDRTGRDRVRMIDYQDALRGHAAYDLVSLLEDARRDVPPPLAERMIARFIARLGLDRAEEEAFRLAYATIGAQRNLKIVGIFARLAIRDGKARYIDLIPRVWDLLMHDLAHPAQARLRAAVLDLAPPPGADVTARLHAQCGARAAERPVGSPGVAAPPRLPAKPSDTAMILAAGLGTRMRPLTETTPKPLLTAGGATLLDRTIERATEAGAERFVVNAHWLGGQIRDHLAARPEPIAVSDESDALLETGGGVVRALPLIDRETFLVLNSDSVWLGERALAPLREDWDPAAMDALLLLVPRGRAEGYTRAGDFTLSPEGRLQRRTGAGPAPYVYSGAQVLTRRLFEGAPQGAFSLNAIWDRAIEEGRAYGVLHRGGWFDVGTPDGLAAADARLRATARS